MKSKIHFLNRNKQTESIVASIWRQIRNAFRERDFWWGLFFVLTLLFLFNTSVEMSVPNYKLGDIAQSTIRSPQDLQIPDQASTAIKQKEAEDAVLPVYDYEPGIANSSTARIREIFAFLRAHEPVQGRRQYEVLSDDVEKHIHLAVDPNFIRLAADKKYSPELEEYLAQKLRTILSQYIVSDRNVMFTKASRGLFVRNRLTNTEEKVTPAAILDIHGVHDLLRTELEKEAQLTGTEARVYADFLNRFVSPTVYFNTRETATRSLAAAHNAEPVFYQIKKGKVIVRDGEEITPPVIAQLSALRDARKVGPPIRYSIGILILLFIYFLGWKKYLNVHQYSDVKLRGKALFQIVGIVLLGNVVLVKLGLLIGTSLSAVFSSGPLNLLFAYQTAVPFAAGALLLTFLTDRQIATIFALSFAMLVGVLTRGDFYLAFYCLTSGVAAAFSIRRYYQRSALLRSCFWIFGANLLTVLTIYLLREMPLNGNEFLFFALCTFISAMLSAAAASVISPVLEYVYNITTDIKLLELSNLDLPVLRQLALEAPGTYHHSIVMGTIAEAAAEKVGANPLFLRVAALYHDIGKVRKSEYYVENQRENFNKHDTLNPRMSALVIMNHVKEGVEVARMLRLPSDVADMIPQHHGTRLITFFYKKAKDMENPALEEVREEDYRYPGPKPQTKEAAILMLADATEAASRTLTDPTPARIRNMINTLFRAIFEDGQLDESNLTMKDLNVISDAFVRKLESVFHHRIAYPGYEFNRDEKPKDSRESSELPEKMANQ